MNVTITKDGLDAALPILKWMRENGVRRFAVDGIEWEIDFNLPEDRYRLALCKLKADYDSSSDFLETERSLREALKVLG